MRPTKQIALDMGCCYIFDEWGRINLRADKVPIGETLIAETLTMNGTFDFTFSPIVKTSRTAMFAFLKHCDLDFKGDDIGDIEWEMERVGKTFIKKLNDSGLYEPITMQDFNGTLAFLDSNMAGVMATITLTEIAGECIDG